MSQGPVSTDPLKAAYASYEQFESRLSKAMDEMVATNGFAEVFTTTATTTMALTKIFNGAIDQAVKATRFAARQDVVDLARQLARTEEKLERLLQAVEDLQDQVAAATEVGLIEAEIEAEVAAAAAPAARRPARRTATKRSAAENRKAAQ